MFKDIEAAYKKAAKVVSADIIIPSGELFQMLIKEGITHIHRDTFHASYGIGRYALGLLWYRSLTRNSVISNTFADFDEEIEQDNIEIIKKCVENIKI